MKLRKETSLYLFSLLLTASLIINQLFPHLWTIRTRSSWKSLPARSTLKYTIKMKSKIMTPAAVLGYSNVSVNPYDKVQLTSNAPSQSVVLRMQQSSLMPRQHKKKMLSRVTLGLIYVEHVQTASLRFSTVLPLQLDSIA